MPPDIPESAPTHPSLTFQDEKVDKEVDDDDSVGVCPSETNGSNHHRHHHHGDLDNTAGSGGGKSSRSDSDEDGATKSKERDDLARLETWQINRLRKIVIQSLMAITLGLCIAVYTVSSSAEQDQYIKQYEGATLIIQDTFNNIMTSRIGIVSSLGVALIAHGEDHSRKWPFVALSSFEERAYTARVQSGAIYLHVNPVVTEEDRYEWEHEYVVGDDAQWM
jgi:hypothetical protein